MKAMPGYVMVDAGGLNLYASSGQTIPGLYNRLAAAMATGKQVILCNCVRSDNTEVAPAAAPVYYVGESIYFNLSSQFAVGADDEVFNLS